MPRRRAVSSPLRDGSCLRWPDRPLVHRARHIRWQARRAVGSPARASEATRGRRVGGKRSGHRRLGPQLGRVRQGCDAVGRPATLGARPGPPTLRRPGGLLVRLHRRRWTPSCRCSGQKDSKRLPRWAERNPGHRCFGWPPDVPYQRAGGSDECEAPSGRGCGFFAVGAFTGTSVDADGGVDPDERLRSSPTKSRSTAPAMAMSHANGDKVRNPAAMAESPRHAGTPINSTPPTMSWMAALRRRRGVQAIRRRDEGMRGERSDPHDSQTPPKCSVTCGTLRGHSYPRF